MDGHHFYQYQVFRHQLNKLQAHKSSFQAWKCVSLGYALFATVMLAAKWHEVSTDLKLLQGISQLLSQQHPIAASGNATTDFSLAEALTMTGANSTLADLADELSENTPEPASAVPQPADLSTSNATSSSDDSAALISHMQVSLGRELNGHQLLKREVEAFLAEFRSAKSTLSLSSLLVFVYIISWILMTLAVNDTRISNDVSLRNILLLSVFGAIDMAASVGFVMVRLITYNVRNNNFVEEILNSKALREAPIRLSPDQLTAFTALRLIGMRSCSAYIDAYVSILVTLLTALRLYAIVRAIAYYRFLRRFNDLNRNLQHQSQLSAAMSMMEHNKTSAKQAHWRAPNTLQGFVAQSGPGPELMRAPSQQWQSERQQASLSGPTTSSTTLRFSPEPIEASTKPTGQIAQFQLLSPNNANKKQQQQQQQQASTFTFGDSPDEATDHQQQQQQQHFKESKLEKPQFIQLAANLDNLAVQTSVSEQQQLNNSRTLVKVTGASRGQQQAGRWSPLLIVQNEATGGTDVEVQRKSARRLGTLSSSLASPNVLLVNGRPHQLVAATESGNEERYTRTQRKRRNHLDYVDSSGGAGFESEPTIVRVERPRSRSRDNQMRLLAAANQIRMNTNGEPPPANRLRIFESGLGSKMRPSCDLSQQQGSFTLLSASQLDRLSRKLLAGATGSLALSKRSRQSLNESRAQVSDGEASLGLASYKYKLSERYRPLKRPTGGSLVELNGGSQQKQQANGGAAFASSRLEAQDEEEEEEDEDGTVRGYAARRKQVSDRRHSRRAQLGGDSTTEISSSGPSTDSDEAQTARAATTPEPLNSNLRAPARRHRRPLQERLLMSANVRHSTVGLRGQRQASRSSLTNLRQTEELNLDPAARGDLLLSKYYYA